MAYWQGGGAIGGAWEPGTGGAPSCNYAAPVFPDPSSADIYGDRIGSGGDFHYGSAPSSSQSSVGCTLSGTPNVAPKFSIDPGVFPGGPISAQWVFDTLGAGGVPVLCKAQLVATSPSPISGAGLTLSYADSPAGPWTIEIATLDGTPQAIAYVRARYWAIDFAATIGAGYWPGVDLTGLALWGGHA